jgi:hypothetical protein
VPQQGQQQGQQQVQQRFAHDTIRLGDSPSSVGSAATPETPTPLGLNPNGPSPTPLGLGNAAHGTAHGSQGQGSMGYGQGQPYAQSSSKLNATPIFTGMAGNLSAIPGVNLYDPNSDSAFALGGSGGVHGGSTGSGGSNHSHDGRAQPSFGSGDKR